MLLRLAEGLTGKALDYGCGYGDVTYALSSQLSIEGVDVSEDRIAFARQQYPELAFNTCDAATTDYPADSFDVVVSSVVAPFVPRVDAYLREIYRMLRSQGALIIASKNIDVLRNAARALLGKESARSSLHVLTARELEQLLIEIGFRIVRRDYFFDPPFASRKNVADLCFGAIRQLASLFHIRATAEYYGFLAVKVA